MEEMNNTDTPQPQTANATGMDAFGAPVDAVGQNEGSADSNLSVEDAFMSKVDDTNTAPQEGQPVDNVVENQPADNRNDEKRYEYWQSQAAKKENEVKALQAQVEQIAQAQQQQAPQAQPEQVEEFPPPPPKPEKPRGFSREEAWSDSSSESARYLDEVESWQDSMNNYRDLRSQYDVALVREQLEARDTAERAKAAKLQQYRQVQEQKSEVYNHVQGHYGLTSDEAAEFVQTMSDPKSISMDNLVQLYRMNKGGAPMNTSQGPSEAFQQSKNAQQVPSPMGVLPAQQAETNRSDSDSIMDDLINTHNSKNPWG